MTNGLLRWVKHGLHVGAGQFKHRAKVQQEYLGSEGVLRIHFCTKRT